MPGERTASAGTLLSVLITLLAIGGVAAPGLGGEPPVLSVGAITQPPMDDPWTDWPDPDFPRTAWTIDYRFRTLASSCTSYEFGTLEAPPAGYSPISRLDFPINSSWHGVELGYRRPRWAIHGEWLTPQQGIHGELADFDWRAPDQPFTDLGLVKQRWTEGQMADLGTEFQLIERCFSLPVEFWPTAGFRWQRFNITAYDLMQVKWNGQWLDPPYSETGDIITFNQQYYIGYVGGQLRTTLRSEMLPPLLLRLQGDWGATEAYNVDHHLAREGDRYTMERTHGDAWHIGLVAEMPFSPRLSLGFQVDHLEIRTTGTHHHYNAPEGEDWTWDNGVAVSSDQTSYGAFVRLRL